MIKANELRIGNILLVDGNFWHVSDILEDPFELYFKENVEYDHSFNAEPIPLTPEILEKTTLKYSEGYDDHWVK